MKLKLSAAAKLAAAQGYTGDAADAHAVQKYLAENVILRDPNGDDVDASTLRVTKSAGVIWLTNEKPTLLVDELPDDADVEADRAIKADKAKRDGKPEADDQVIESHVRKALRDLGVVNKDGAPASGEVTVKTVAERVFEDEAKAGKTAFKDYRRASLFGDYIISQLPGVVPGFTADSTIVREANKNLRDAIARKDLTGLPGSGGVLTGTQFFPEIINLVDQFGVVGRFARVINMTDRDAAFFQSTGRLPVSYPSENASTSPTNVQNTWVRRNLSAKDAQAIAIITRQISADSKVSIAEHTVRELARAFAYEEDNNAINGDGSLTFGRMVGLSGAFNGNGGTGLTLATARNAVNTNLAGTAAGNWNGYTRGHFEVAMSRLPEYAYAADPAWYCSRSFWASVIQPILNGLGGVTRVEGGNSQEQMFLGYPVRLVEVMNRNADTGASTIDCYFGSMNLAVLLGRRQELDLFTSEHAYFAQNAIAVRATARFDVNVTHGVGPTTTAFNAGADAGPIVALYQS